MQRTRSLFRRISAAEEDGLTLVELSFTMVLLLIVVVSLTTIFVSVQRSAAFVEDRSATLDEMRLTLGQVAKQIRQATALDPTSTTSRIRMKTSVNGVDSWVVYQASGTTLTRSIDGATPTVFQEGLASTTLFTYEPDATDVRLVTLLLSVRPDHSPDTVVVLSSEVRLRNRDEP